MKILLHACCAPCSGAVIEALLNESVVLTVFYYNPNIHPLVEYERRKAENKRFAEKLGVPFVDADYDSPAWFARVKGLEDEPERGARCTQCFDMRLVRTALHAHENGFDGFATSLGISRHKDLTQVDASGHRAAALYTGLRYIDRNWRRQGGTERSAQIAHDEGFYRQNYCGCVFSLRHAEARLAKNPESLP